MKIYASAFGPFFFVLDNNARPHKTAIFDNLRERKGCAYEVASLLADP